MQPAAATTPVLREMPLTLAADASAVSMARIKGRSWLTMLNWPGSVHAATDVLHHLVDNAMRHGFRNRTDLPGLDLCFRVTESHELLIDVMDPNPTFRDFDLAVGGELGRGLWAAQQAGARLTWFVGPDWNGKTVRATMQPSRVEL
ncbi:ATP-binding protein [Streptomyces sp. NPDC055059]